MKKIALAILLALAILVPRAFAGEDHPLVVDSVILAYDTPPPPARLLTAGMHLRATERIVGDFHEIVTEYGFTYWISSFSLNGLKRDGAP
jgi:hypothetical protein